jgi:hypothetical protein
MITARGWRNDVKEEQRKGHKIEYSTQGSNLKNIGKENHLL